MADDNNDVTHDRHDIRDYETSQGSPKDGPFYRGALRLALIGWIAVGLVIGYQSYRAESNDIHSSRYWQLRAISEQAQPIHGELVMAEIVRKDQPHAKLDEQRIRHLEDRMKEFNEDYRRVYREAESRSLDPYWLAAENFGAWSIAYWMGIGILRWVWQGFARDPKPKS